MITNANSRNDYTSSGGATYAYTFAVLSADEVTAYDAGVLVSSSSYTVTGVGNAGGGNVIFDAAITSGHAVALVRSVALTQDYNPIDHDPFSASGVEAALDHVMMGVQQVNEQLDRVPMVPASSTQGPITLPVLVSGQMLRVNASCDGFDLVTVGSGAIATPVSIANGGTGGTTLTTAHDTLKVQPTVSGTVAATPTIDTGDLDYVILSGSATISTIAAKNAGRVIYLANNGGCLIQNGTSIQTARGLDIGPTDTKLHQFICNGTNWIEVWPGAFGIQDAMDSSRIEPALGTATLGTGFLGNSAVMDPYVTRYTLEDFDSIDLAADPATGAYARTGTAIYWATGQRTDLNTDSTYSVLSDGTTGGSLMQTIKSGGILSTPYGFAAAAFSDGFYKFRFTRVGTTAGLRFIGLGEGLLNANPNNGIYFRFNTTGNLFGVVRASGVETTQDMGVTVPVGTYRSVAFVMVSSGVQFFLEQAAVGSPISTNIPAVALGFSAAIASATITAANGLRIDYWCAWTTRLRP